MTATLAIAPETGVALLYVDPTGHYPQIVAEWFDAARDARTYAGALPVVAHPPCQLWVNFAALNFQRYGGEHNRPGNDGGCFASALANVRRCGGVLEHPAIECVAGARAHEADRHRLDALRAGRVGLRGLAERLRASGAPTDLAALPRRHGTL